MPRNVYFCFDDCLIFQGKLGSSSKHAHHYVQLGYSGSATFHLEHDSSSFRDPVNSFFIPSDHAHQLRLSGQDTVIMIWLDPEFQATQTFFAHSDILPLPSDFQQLLKPLYNQTLDCEKAHKIRTSILNRSSHRQESIDDRVVQSIRWLKSNLVHQSITTGDLCEVAHLSKSRFMHLFSDQIGIPVRKFILWQRLKKALEHLADGSNITQSAHLSGFTDSAHMNRTFKSMFGITPSAIFKNSRFIQFFSC
jgi:AraC-like DNA-binding protein